MKNLVLNFQLLATYTKIFMNYTKNCAYVFITFFNHYIKTIKTTYKEPCIKFSSFFGYPKFFIDN
ncbi:hypothetical protein FWK35_00012406, partial [Aphis craccivora]